MRLCMPLLAAVALVGCGERGTTADDLNTIGLTLPDGRMLRVEAMVHPNDLQRGMMFRAEMKPGHGMLFFMAG